MRYTIIIQKGKVSGYIAECPSIPGCVSQGQTIAETRKNIRQAILDCLEVINEEVRKRARKMSSRTLQVAV